MNRFDGTAARQLVLVDDQEAPIVPRDPRAPRRPQLRMLQQDIYAELARRRAKPTGARHGGDGLQLGQARPTHCVTMLISLSPFDELIRSLRVAHISLRKSENQGQREGVHRQSP